MEGKGMTPLLYMAVGSGMRSTIAGLLRNFVPGVGISEDMLTGAVGYIGAMKTKGTIRDVMAGVFVGSVGAIIQGAMSGVPLFGGAPASTTTTYTPATAAQLAAAEAAS
jgi:hypothetical protein